MRMPAHRDWLLPVVELFAPRPTPTLMGQPVVMVDGLPGTDALEALMRGESGVPLNVSVDGERLILKRREEVRIR